MADRTNTLQSDYGVSSFDDYYEATREAREIQLEEDEETLRHYFGDDISFAKGKEDLMAYSAKMSHWDEEALKWIKNGWMWYDKDDEEWLYSAEGKKRYQENVKIHGL